MNDQPHSHVPQRGTHVIALEVGSSCGVCQCLAESTDDVHGCTQFEQWCTGGHACWCWHQHNPHHNRNHLHRPDNGRAQQCTRTRDQHHVTASDSAGQDHRDAAAHLPRSGVEQVRSPTTVSFISCNNVLVTIDRACVAVCTPLW
jgi:hypothetical protein